MVPPLLHLADSLRHHPGEEGQEGHDGRARHELGDPVHALVHLVDKLDGEGARWFFCLL